MCALYKGRCLELGTGHINVECINITYSKNKIKSCGKYNFRIKFSNFNHVYRV